MIKLVFIILFLFYEGWEVREWEVWGEKNQKHTTLVEVAGSVSIMLLLPLARR
jgi:hypothetical protein